MLDVINGIAHCDLTSLSNDLCRASLFSLILADW